MSQSNNTNLTPIASSYSAQFLYGGIFTVLSFVAFPSLPLLLLLSNCVMISFLYQAAFNYIYFGQVSYEKFFNIAAKIMLVVLTALVLWILPSFAFMIYSTMNTGKLISVVFGLAHASVSIVAAYYFGVGLAVFTNEGELNCSLIKKLKGLKQEQEKIKDFLGDMKAGNCSIDVRCFSGEKVKIFFTLISNFDQEKLKGYFNALKTILNERVQLEQEDQNSSFIGIILNKQDFIEFIEDSTWGSPERLDALNVGYCRQESKQNIGDDVSHLVAEFYGVSRRVEVDPTTIREQGIN